MLKDFFYRGEECLLDSLGIGYGVGDFGIGEVKFFVLELDFVVGVVEGGVFLVDFVVGVGEVFVGFLDFIVCDLEGDVVVGDLVSLLDDFGGSFGDFLFEEFFFFDEVLEFPADDEIHSCSKKESI